MLDTIAVVISLLSFSLSLWLAIQTFLKKRESFSIDALDYRIWPNNIMQLYLRITNYSDSPLVIGSLKCNGIPCKLEATKVFGTPGNYNARTTADFPIRISPHDMQLIYLVFHDERLQGTTLENGTTVHFQIQTTGCLSQQSIRLPHTGYYLHRDQYD